MYPYVMYPDENYDWYADLLNLISGLFFLVALFSMLFGIATSTLRSSVSVVLFVNSGVFVLWSVISFLIAHMIRNVPER